MNPKPTLFVGVGIHARLAKGEKLPAARFVAVDEEVISITLKDGRKLNVPLHWYPRLKHGTPGERNTWKLLIGGIAILWRDLEQVINVEEALNGKKSREPAESLAKWLAERSRSRRQHRKAG